MAVAGVEAWLVLTPDLRLGDAPFRVLCGLACWLPAWACADLLATRYRGDPDPHREWRPVELLARAAGRLLPLYAALALWTGTYTARALLADLQRPANAAPGSDLVIRHWSQFVPWWIAWTAVFLASGLPYAAGAGLLSAVTRRPRRWAVTPLVVVFGSLALFLALRALYERLQGAGGIWPGAPGALTLTEVALFGVWPNFAVGFASASCLMWGLQRAAPGVRVDFAGICWLATAAFLFYAVVLSLAVWWVAARRRRRRPG